jgi:hypothetical protein
MIINRSHLPWAFLVAGATLVLSAAYLEVFRPGSIPHFIPVPGSAGNFPFGHRSVGATPLGIVYGIAAYLIFIFAALLGARKKVRHWRIGRAETWMRAHIWLSILTIPLVLMHCGFRSGSAMTTSLLILYAVVMASGFYGLALQQFIPRQMTDRVGHEVIYDQIPYLRKVMVQSALELQKELASRPAPAGVARGTPAFGESATGAALAVEDTKAEEARATLREMLEYDVLPYLKAGKGAGRGSRLRLGRRQVSDNVFRMVAVSVGEDYRAKVDEMQRWCDSRRQMDLQTMMQHWLHYWLLVHVPASLLLLIWTAWHAVTGLVFY